jgi:hypothetical protein
MRCSAEDMIRALLHALAPYGETLILPALVAVLLLALGLAG